MNKEEFLSLLRERLSIFPPEETEKYISYYSEMIDDHIDDGFSEEKVIETIGSVDDVFAVILQETAITQLLKNRMKPKRRLKMWELLLWIFLSPIWIPLAAAAVVLILSLYIVLWSLILCIYAVELSFAACAVGGTAVSVLMLFESNGFAAGILLGGGLICTGLTILFFFPCKLATKGAWKLSKRILLGIKFLIIGKERKI